jgi:hypothetical protein
MMIYDIYRVSRKTLTRILFCRFLGPGHIIKSSRGKKCGGELIQIHFSGWHCTYNTRSVFFLRLNHFFEALQRLSINLVPETRVYAYTACSGILVFTSFLAEAVLQWNLLWVGYSLTSAVIT